MGRLLPKAGDTQGSYSPDDRWLERWKEGWVDWQVHQSMAWCPSSTSLRVFDSRYSRFPSCKHFIGQKYPRYSSQSSPLGKQFDSKPVAIIRFGCPQVVWCRAQKWKPSYLISVCGVIITHVFIASSHGALLISVILKDACSSAWGMKDAELTTPKRASWA